MIGLPRKYHPDLNKDLKANQRMKDINEAYEILGNLENRRRYHPVWLQRSRTGKTNPEQDSRTQEAERQAQEAARQAREAQEREQEAIRKTREAEERAREAELRAMRAEYQSQQSRQTKDIKTEKPTQSKQSTVHLRRNKSGSKWISWVVGILAILLIVAIGRVIVPTLFSQSVPETSTLSPLSIINNFPKVAIKNVELPPDVKVSNGDSVFTTIVTLENYESRDITVNWEGVSSSRGKFDYGVTVVPNNGIKEISRSYFYSQKGTELITYKINYTDAYLKTSVLDEWTGTLNVLPSTTTKPTIALSLTSGSRDTKVTIYGFNFTPFGTVKASNVTVNGTPQLSGYLSSIDSTGSFKFNIYFLVNQPAGSVIISVVDSSGLSASTHFTVIVPTQTAKPAEISLSPASGFPGSSISIVGKNFTPYGTVKSENILWNNLPCTGSFVTNIDGLGNITLSITLSSNQLAGTYNVTVKDSAGKSASTAFTVINPVSTTTTPAPMPTLSLSPNSGIPESQFTIYGNKFTPNGTVKSTDILWNGSPLTFIQTYSIDASGTVSIPLMIKSGTYPGTYSIRVTDSSGKNASGSFTVTAPQTTLPASITLSPVNGTPGSTVTIIGHNFTPNGTITMSNILWNGVPCTGSTVNIDNLGNFSVIITISINQSLGSYAIVVIDSLGKKASAAFTVN